jgi:putative SOS response-associated peptidase YedK
MCGRFAMDDTINDYLAELVAEHGWRVLDDLSDYLPRYNIKPTNRIPVLLHSAKLGADVVAGARWGFIPAWAKSLQAAPRTTFNARSEAAMWREDDQRASLWRTPLTRGRRCLIPASGYFEWSGPQTARVPHWIHPTSGMLGFAGLYGWWTDPGRAPDDPGRTCLTVTMLTMASVPELAAIHDRNPVALPRAAWWDWLNPGVAGDQPLVDDMVRQARPVLAGLRQYEVARFATMADGPELITARQP